MKFIKYMALVCLGTICFGCGQDDNALTEEELAIEAPKEIKWEALIPEGYQPELIFSKYQPILEKFEDNDAEAEATYEKMMSEINNAPLNTEIDQQHIKIGGFIAPLVFLNGDIVEFLLVPYFGACIHVPPPPTNQIILVKTTPEHAIDGDKAYFPVWVSGVISVEKQTTDIGEAGYRIQDAATELYEHTIL